MLKENQFVPTCTTVDKCILFKRWMHACSRTQNKTEKQIKIVGLCEKNDRNNKNSITVDSVLSKI